MLNKKLITAAVSTALLSGMGATAAQAFEISANVALVSDYRFRGISQTGTDAAIQGGFDASWEPGFYVGTQWQLRHHGNRLLRRLGWPHR